MWQFTETDKKVRSFAVLVKPAFTQMYIFMAPGNSFKNFFLNFCLLKLFVPKKKKKKVTQSKEKKYLNRW